MTPDPSEQLDHQPRFRPSRRTTKSLALLGSALLLIGTGMGWQVWHKRGNIAIGQPQQPQGFPVKLETLTPATITISSDYVGSLEAEQVVEIRPEITGRVRRLFVQAGDRVVQGQQIAQLQPDQAQANLDGVIASVTAAQANRASFQANVNSAHANRATALFQLNALKDELVARYADAELAYEDYARIEFLVREGVLAPQELDRAERDRDVAIANLRSLRQQVAAAEASLAEANANFESAQAEFDEAKAGFAQAEAERDRAQAELQDTIITAPFAGVVGDIPARTGDVVTDSDTLTTLTQNNLLSLRISVPTERAVELTVGQFVELVTEQGNILNTGQISFIDANIEPSRQTVLAKATFRNAGTILRNGQFVRARLVWRTEPGILISPTAITRLAGKPFVFVATPPGPEDEASADIELIARQRPVELGKLQNNRYQVVSGLKPGEQIVVSGTQNLTNDAPLMVLPPDAPESDFVAP
ncbi:MAG: efflux RND transporter periplasmic adaptor subunit [Spirulina sp. SIO3F2]|nr:efflux RND transporter periplasmic adaptor subunit [Spirulina sp. SIO3F2]